MPSSSDEAETVSGPELARAIAAGDVRLVKRYIRQCQPVNSKIAVPHPLNNSEYKTFPVHYAVQKGQLRIVKLLMKHGANPRLIDGDRYTAKNWLQHMRSQPHDRDDDYADMETLLNSASDPRLGRTQSNPSLPRSRSSSRSSSRKRSSRRQITDLPTAQPLAEPIDDDYAAVVASSRTLSQRSLELDQQQASHAARQYQQIAAASAPNSARPQHARPPHTKPPLPSSGCTGCLIS